MTPLGQSERRVTSPWVAVLGQLAGAWAALGAQLRMANERRSMMGHNETSPFDAAAREAVRAAERERGQSVGRVKLCMECRGTGVVGSPVKRPCPVCKGTGER